MKKLHGRIALVTGSSSGIGKGIALHLAGLGACVAITSRTLASAERVAEEIVKCGGQAFPCRFDIDNQSTIAPLLALIDERHGGLDILVNNALSRPSIVPMPLQDMAYAQLQAGINANLTNTLELTVRAFPYLKVSKGIVVNIGSAAASRHMLGLPLYSVIKGALGQATRVLAAEWGVHGVRVNQINPGVVQTDAHAQRFGKEESAKLMAGFGQYHPLGRVGRAEDIAELAGFMVSDQASWMTGAVVDLDGGYTQQGVAFPSAD